LSDKESSVIFHVMVLTVTEHEPREDGDSHSISQRRSTRALSNDAAIRSATVKLILKTGIDSISFREVGREAGLTHGALYARFEDAEELLVDLWSEVLCDRMIRLLDAARSAALNPSEDSIEALLDFVRDAEPTDVAAVVVLFASRRFIVLHEEVEDFIHQHLEIREGLTNAIYSRTLALFSEVTIKIFSNLAYGIDTERFEFFRVVLHDALMTAPEDVKNVPLMPEVGATPRLHDNFQSQLAYQTFSAVARSGYHRATISRISRRANCSPGAIYKLYPSKDALVVAALRNQMQGPGMTAMRLAKILDEGALAESLSAAANDQDPVRKYFTLEMFMASAHNAVVRDALGAQLAKLIKADSYVVDLPERERQNFKHMINEIIVLVLAVSFLTTVTDAAGKIDFNQIGEPIRRTLLRLFPSWPEMSRQLKETAATLPRSYGDAG
jgi:AcrR family transcriptional regulator